MIWYFWENAAAVQTRFFLPKRKKCHVKGFSRRVVTYS